MKNRYSILLFLFVTLIAACGKGKTDNNLAAKQKKLEKLETQSDALDKEIKTLKEEISFNFACCINGEISLEHYSDGDDR